MESLTASHAPQTRRVAHASTLNPESGEASWPIPLQHYSHAGGSEPMARGDWPAFCAEAIRLHDLDKKGRNGRNGRVAKKMKVATTTIRRAVGSFPAIVAFADGNPVIARSLALIPFASAVILANWAKRDRKAALEALDDCGRGLGTSTLSQREIASRKPRSSVKWKAPSAKAITAEAESRPGVPTWVLRARHLLRDLAKAKPAERAKVIATHTQIPGRSPASALARACSLQELIALTADKPKLRAMMGITAEEAAAPAIPVEPADSHRIGAMARRTLAKLSHAVGDESPAAKKSVGHPRRGKVLMSRRRSAVAAWPLKGAMPRGARDWLTAGHWHLIAQDAYKSGMAPTRFAQKKGMLAGTLGIAVRTLVDASELAKGDEEKAKDLSQLSTAAVRAVRLLHNVNPAKAEVLVRSIGKLGHSSVLVKALALDDGVTAKDIAAIARRHQKEAAA